MEIRLVQHGRDLQVEILGGDAADTGDPSFILLSAEQVTSTHLPTAHT